MKKYKQTFEMIRFLAVGGGCFLLDYLLLFVLTEYGRLSYLTAAGISFTISFFINYFLCVAWVFHKAKKQSLRQGVLFIGSSIAGLGINQLCMWSFVELFSMHYMFAKIFAAAIVTIWNYICKRKAVQV